MCSEKFQDDKRQKASYYFNNVLHRIFTGFDSKSDLKLLILDCDI